jgi:hypothetical protein
MLRHEWVLDRPLDEDHRKLLIPDPLKLVNQLLHCHLDTTRARSRINKNPPQIGLRTTHHGQAMKAVSFSPMKSTVKRERKLIR